MRGAFEPLPKSHENLCNSIRLRRCPRFVENPRDEYRDYVKNKHRRGEQQHVCDIACWRQEGGTKQNDDQRSLPNSDHEPGSDEANPRQNVCYSGHLKHDAHTQHDEDDEVEIVGRLQ